MATTNFIILTTIAFVAIAPTVMSSGPQVYEQECYFKEDPKNPGRYGSRTCNQCDKHVSSTCAKDPYCPVDSKTCLVLVEHLHPLSLDINWCDLLKVKSPLGSPSESLITFDSLCIDIFWDLCPETALTKISIKFKNCTLHIEIKDYDDGINCISLKICQLLDKLPRLL